MTSSLRPQDHEGGTRAGGMPLPPAVETADPPAVETPAKEAAPAAGKRAKASPGRDPFFDNAKYLAILFVAMGHSWEPLTDHSRAAEALYMVVYTFHMPAFIVISGYFSRSFDMRPDRLKRLITGVAVPYVLFEVAYTFFKRWADDDPQQPISLLDPWYLTWFLAALFVWRMSTPLWKVVRWPLPLALAVAVLASVSPDIGDDLDLQRVLQFLPFFVAGLLMKPEHFRQLRGRKLRLLSLPVLACGAVVAYWAAPRMNSAWFYHRDSAQELGAPWWAGAVMTLALFGCSAVLTACFLVWVPRRRMWFTVLGAGTLYGYLLHGFLAKGSRFWGWFDTYEWLKEPPGEVFVTLVAAVVVTALCTPPVQRAFKFAMEPKMNWAFAKDPAEQARRRSATR
ncbi:MULTISPECIES: acyltransferase family protein [Streptomyces]|uniref:Putative integral membrane protein n=1 Tax=Streptomyces albus (strain ATCC 21838 / DSM 41398 / FERM P-419 / JCM 4703 / NBRC 107858) TaxID=1081613 RepID=A0A0B5F5J0_STRA4|nr:acyltransferase family protein [Streptomyces sp. SCSIO ZS0520]AJE85637.1 putative integral membrane protein [Streptomyces albus]AOU79939.1 putative integral membrane protein [Streptomyces albus]